MGRPGSNHESNRVESRVEQGRIMGRTGSYHESIRADRVEQVRIMSRTRSNHELHKVATYLFRIAQLRANILFAQSRNKNILSRAKPHKISSVA